MSLNDDMDWKAAMSSEIFREFAAQELKKRASEKAKEKDLEAAEIEDELDTLEQFASLEFKIKDSPKQLRAFRELQSKFQTDPEYTAKTDPLFVKAVLMLNLDS